MKNSGYSKPALWLLITLFSLVLAACVPEGVTLPQSPLLSVLERKSGLIALIGTDGNIYTVDQGGDRLTPVTNDAQFESAGGGKSRFYQYPAWSQDGSKLAYVAIEGTTAGVEHAALLIADRDGSDHIEAFRSTDHYPFYLYWSPDGQKVSFLTTPASGTDLKLHVVPSAGGESRVVYTGWTIYWSWSPDNHTMLIHLGGAAKSDPNSKLALVDIEGNGVEKDLGLLPTSFQAPAWSPRGDELLLGAETEGGAETLLIADRQGAVKQQLAVLDGPVAFGWSPDGKKLAYISRESQGEDNAVKTLTVIDPKQPEEMKKVVKDGDIFSFLWSPNSQKIAYFVPKVVATEGAGGGEGSTPAVLLAVEVFDVRKGVSTEVATFLPTSQFINLLPFFDQFQQSATLWSPDSKHLVLSLLTSEGDKGIYVVEASGKLEPRYIAAGELAFWSWK